MLISWAARRSLAFAKAPLAATCAPLASKTSLQPHPPFPTNKTPTGNAQSMLSTEYTAAFWTMQKPK